MMLLARLQVESTRLLNRFCAVLTEKRTGFNQAEADRYLADRQVIRVQMDTPFWPVAEEMTPDIRAVFVQVLLPEHKTHDWRDKDGREWRWNNHDWRRSDGVLFHPHGLGVEIYGPFMRLDPHTSAASNPPGAADAGPVQDPPPALGHPDSSPTNASASRAVDGEGSGVASDIPQSATPERPTSVGRCGQQIPWNMGLATFCCLPSGHAGWHRDDAGAEWGVASTPDTTDLIDDPEVELALVRCERDAALRRLGRYRDTFGPLPE